MTRRVVALICAASAFIEALRLTNMVLLATAVGIFFFTTAERGLSVLEEAIFEEQLWLRRMDENFMRRLSVFSKVLKERSFERAFLNAIQGDERPLEVKLRSGEDIEEVLEGLSPEERMFFADIFELSKRSTKNAATYVNELFKVLSRFNRVAQRYEEWRKLLSIRVKLLIVAFSITLGFLSALIPAIVGTLGETAIFVDQVVLLFTFYAIASISTHVISVITGSLGRNLALATACYMASAVASRTLTAPLSF